ncbi:Transmembrane GTPase FZO1 [Kluyveromyces marxianus]
MSQQQTPHDLTNGDNSQNEHELIEDHPLEITSNELQSSISLTNGQMNRLLQSHSSHRRDRSRDHMFFSHLTQQSYSLNRNSLLNSINTVRPLINDLITENNQRAIYIPENPDSLEVLQLKVKLDGKDNMELDKSALSQLFKAQALSAIDHLTNLQTRVQDISSKVFITGDLNSGKSTLCNAFLRKKVLPEDQLPCTNVFCEIVEARENMNMERVHAIPKTVASSVKDATILYDIRDKSTYEDHPLEKLDQLVYDNEHYILLKVFIKDDKRPVEYSLLRNGTADISLIDSPGLNMDSVKTTEVMSRQEEIDLVVFVVNAENQLTLSAREFITMASREKKLMFFVVNKFDHIKDKERCKKLILDQIKEISPETYKLNKEFVHFVSSHGKIPDDGGDGPDGDGPEDDNGILNDDDPDFDQLEDNLRNFVFKKRSLSKLLPAKTYLIKLLKDIEKISACNLEKYKQEDCDLNAALEELQPQLQDAAQRCARLVESIDKISEFSTKEVYGYTKMKINQALKLSPSEFPPYTGLSSIYDYVQRVRTFIIDQILTSVQISEEYARNNAEESVKEMHNLAKEQLGDNFMSNLVFKSDLMFTKKKHNLSRKLDVPLGISNFLDPSVEGFISYLSWGLVKPPLRIGHDSSSKEDTSSVKKNSWSQSLALSSYSVSQYWTNPSLIFTSKIPTLLVYSFGGSTMLRNALINGSMFFSLRSLKKLSGSLLIVGSFLGIAYLIHDLPRALPMKLSEKYRERLLELDYAHNNADRVSKEVSQVFKFPTREVVKACELVVDKKTSKKKEVEAQLRNNAMSIDFFQALLSKSQEQRSSVESINLEVD